MHATGRSPAGSFRPESVSAGVDWVTYIADGREGADALVSALQPIARDLLRAGEKRRPFRFMRWQGESLGALRLGVHRDTAVAQLSGKLCDDTWTRLASLSGRATRVDLQTTLLLSESLTGFARSLLKPSERTRQLRPEDRVPTSYSSSTRGLRIGTVGRRTGRRYLRVYDKGVESGTHPPGKLWRVELEAKRDLAPKLWNTLRTATDVPQLCYGSCAHAWKDSGLRWPLPRPGRESAIPSPDPRKPSPAHTLAAWLRTSVAPTIPRVLTAYTVAEVLEMLGLENAATPRCEVGNREEP